MTTGVIELSDLTYKPILVETDNNYALYMIEVTDQAQLNLEPYEWFCMLCDEHVDFPGARCWCYYNDNMPD